MITYIDEIIADIDWRISELALLKTMPIKYSLRDDYKDVYVKYSIPAIYSVWEGFVKKCFIIYSNYLNTLSLKRNEIALALLTHRIDSECDFNNPRLNFDSKQKLVESLNSILVDTITISPSIPTESNVNFKVLNKIMERFCVVKIDEKYEKGLNKLLRFRNTIAHGENSIIVNSEHLVEFIQLIENLMLDVVINIQHSAKNETYKFSV